jgi:hypothetical protein
VVLVAVLWAVPAMRSSWIGLVVLVLLSVPVVVLGGLFGLLAYWRRAHPQFETAQSHATQLSQALLGQGPEARKTALSAYDRIQQICLARPNDRFLQRIHLSAMTPLCAWAAARCDDEVLLQAHTVLTDHLDAGRIGKRDEFGVAQLLEEVALGLCSQPEAADLAYRQALELLRRDREGYLFGPALQKKYDSRLSSRLLALKESLTVPSGGARAGDALTKAYIELRHRAELQLGRSAGRVFLEVTLTVARRAVAAGDEELMASIPKDVDRILPPQAGVLQGLPDRPTEPVCAAIDAVREVALHTAAEPTRQRAVEVLSRLVDEYPERRFRYETLLRDLGR